MSSSQVGSEGSTEIAAGGIVDMKLEVVVVPAARCSKEASADAALYMEGAR